jgi:hypothetical protein
VALRSRQTDTNGGKQTHRHTETNRDRQKRTKTETEDPMIVESRINPLRHAQTHEKAREEKGESETDREREREGERGRECVWGERQQSRASTQASAPHDREELGVAPVE